MQVLLFHQPFSLLSWSSIVFRRRNMFSRLFSVGFGLGVKERRIRSLWLKWNAGLISLQRRIMLIIIGVTGGEFDFNLY